MPRPPRLRRAVAVVVAGAAVLLTGPAVAAPAPIVEIDVAALDRGPNARVPYIAGSTIVDGTERIPLAFDNASLLGVSGDDYVLWAVQGSRPPRVLRVTPDGDATVLVRGGDAFNAVLSTDGTQIAVPRMRLSQKRTVVNVHDASTGGLEATTTVRGFGTVLDIDRDDVVIGTTSPRRTIVWTVGDGTRTTLTRTTGYQADLATDRLAVFTKDPFRGGCSRVTTLADPTGVLSESCDERVYEFSPDGRRMATIDLLTDGLGPARVTVRKIAGAAVATYDAPFFFGVVTWESDRVLLLETNGRKRSAVVRCTGADCERASKLGPAPEVRRLATFRLARP
jgi:hypothetical protein